VENGLLHLNIVYSKQFDQHFR